MRTSSTFKSCFLKADAVREGSAEADYRRQSVSSLAVRGMRVIRRLNAYTVEEFQQATSKTPREMGLTCETILDEESNPLQCVLTTFSATSPARIVELYSDNQDARVQETWQTEQQQLRENQGRDLFDYVRGQSIGARSARMKRGGTKLESIEDLQARAAAVEDTVDMNNEAPEKAEEVEDEAEVVVAGTRAPLDLPQAAKRQNKRRKGSSAAAAAAAATATPCTANIDPPQLGSQARSSCGSGAQRMDSVTQDFVSPITTELHLCPTTRIITNIVGLFCWTLSLPFQ